MSSVLQVSPIAFDRVLESASMLAWSDLMPETPDAVMQVEYRGNQHALEYLKVWGSVKRGYWNIIGVCESSPTGLGRLNFADGYDSHDYADMLALITHQQAAFAREDTVGQSTILAIHAPSSQDRAAAEAVLRQALDEEEFAAMLPSHRKPVAGADVPAGRMPPVPSEELIRA